MHVYCQLLLFNFGERTTEMLECYELWNTAAEIIKLSWIAAVNDLSNQVSVQPVYNCLFLDFQSALFVCYP